MVFVEKIRENASINPDKMMFGFATDPRSGIFPSYHEW